MKIKNTYITLTMLTMVGVVGLLQTNATLVAVSDDIFSDETETPSKPSVPSETAAIPSEVPAEVKVPVEKDSVGSIDRELPSERALLEDQVKDVSDAQAKAINGNVKESEQKFVDAVNAATSSDVTVSGLISSSKKLDKDALQRLTDLALFQAVYDGNHATVEYILDHASVKPTNDAINICCQKAGALGRSDSKKLLEKQGHGCSIPVNTCPGLVNLDSEGKIKRDCGKAPMSASDKSK